MVDPVTIGALVVATLNMAADAALKGAVGEAVKDGYKALKAKVSQWALGDVVTLDIAPSSKDEQFAVAKIIDAQSEDDRKALRVLAEALVAKLKESAPRSGLDIKRLTDIEVQLRNITGEPEECQLDVLLLCGRPPWGFAKALWDELLPKQKQKGIAKVWLTYYEHDAWAKIGKGFVNCIFLAPFEFTVEKYNFDALMANQDARKRKAEEAKAFIEKVRINFNRIVFVLYFENNERENEFMKLTSARFQKYFMITADGAGEKLPSIIKDCINDIRASGGGNG